MSEKLNILKKALINADLNGAEEEVKRANTPTEYRARMDIGTDGGFFVSTPRTAGELPDAIELFKDFDLDPEVWTVVSVRKSRWQRYDGEWLEAARVNVKPAQQEQFGYSGADYDALVEEIIKWKPKKVETSTGPLYAIYAIGDTQYGKDANGGTEATVERVTLGIQESVTRHKELLKIGRKIGTVVLPQLGDCIEGSTSQKGMVIGRSDLGVTQQVRLGRRVLMAWVKAFAPLCEELIIPVVPGNHDEPHRIMMTDPIDSWQIEVVAAVQDACAENPALSHVKFMYPKPDHQTLAVDLGGTIVGLAHGHQAKDMGKWIAGQATGRTPVGSADVLMTGHFHHFRADQVGPRLWIQVPAMDGGSAWFRDKSGLESPTGIVSLVVGDGYDPRRDLAVLAGENRLP
jgi:predicted phosphodiesterase